MAYNEKPKMILFDVGGTLFDDGRCIPADGLAKLRLAADNPDVTDDATLVFLWNAYADEVYVGHQSKSGTVLDLPLSAIIKYVTMKAGLHFHISMPEQEEIFDRYNSTRTVMGGISELLTALHEHGIRTAVISNNAMSGDGLALAIKRWIPEEKFEFFLTSADVSLCKPDKAIFEAAAAYAFLSASDCWYCGDSKIADVDGAKRGGMTPVLLDSKSEKTFEMRADGEKGEYLTVNHWDVLKEHLLSL